MTDTQWPAYQVFKQDRAGVPHENVGTVHAPDAEMALLHARDVYVRRPACASLWVAPVTSLTSKTAEEWAREPIDAAHGPHPAVPFLVFRKESHRGSHVFVGRVMAGDGPRAVHKAAEQYPSPPALVWWVVPEVAVTRSDPDEAEAMFAPAEDKSYRDQAFYRTDTMLREIELRRAREGQNR
jgi:ring-1,2-phenylacetyl-CoA epoxidase subunit PaaB